MEVAMMSTCASFATATRTRDAHRRARWYVIGASAVGIAAWLLAGPLAAAPITTIPPVSDFDEVIDPTDRAAQVPPTVSMPSTTRPVSAPPPGVTSSQPTAVPTTERAARPMPPGTRAAADHGRTADLWRRGSASSGGRASDLADRLVWSGSGAAAAVLLLVHHRVRRRMRRTASG